MNRKNSAVEHPPLLEVPSLDNLPSGIQNFVYSKSEVTVTHWHVGLGYFAMAHIASIADLYMNVTGKRDWGINAVSMHSRETIEALRKSGHRIVIEERQNDSKREYVVGSIIGTYFLPDDPLAVINKMAAPETKLLSFTVTSGGHHMSDQSGNLNLTAPAVVHDLNYHGERGDSPETIHWVIAAFADFRMKLEAETGTVLPCSLVSLDNAPNNSLALKKAVIQYIQAAYENPEKLIEWIETRLQFLNTVVDRITPRDTVSAHDQFRAEYGFDPAILVRTEMQWQLAIEKGRYWVPDWSLIGVQNVDSIEQYWKAKFLALNAAHQILGTFGLRLGLKYIYEVMAIPEMAGLVELFHNELAVFLGSELMTDYGAKVRRRFADRALEDQNRRVVAKGREKASARVAYSFELAMQASDGRQTALVPVFTFAGWLLNLACTDERGFKFDQDDPDLPLLTEVSDGVADWIHSDHDQQRLARIIRRIGELFADNRMIMLANKSIFINELAWSLLEISHYGCVVAAQHLLER